MGANLESHSSKPSWAKKATVLVVILAGIAYYLKQGKEPPKPSPIVETSQGKIQGIVSYSRAGNEVYEYLGIPYAKKPIGDLRFEVQYSSNPSIQMSVDLKLI
jgi:hypothetical protein